MAPAVDPSEIVNLAIALLAVPVLIRTMGAANARRRRPFGFGYLALLLALVATIVESFVAPDLLNAIEHALYALAGIGFAVALLRTNRSVGSS